MKTHLKLPLLAAIAAASVLFGTSSLPAATITILNPSFEANTSGPPVTDWGGGFIGVNSTDPDPDLHYLTTPYGTNYGYVYPAVVWGSSNGWFLSQQTAYTAHTGDQFTLSVAIGNNSGSSGDELTSSYTGRVQLTINGVTVASFTGDSTTIPSGGFLTVSIDYTATLADNNQLVGIRLGSSTGAVGGPYFDNVQLSVAAVPEPSTIALLGISLGGALILRRKR